MVDEHVHHYDKKITSLSKLIITILLNLLITIAEVIGGMLSGSLSLISDAIHNLGDTISIVSTAVAIKFSYKKANKNFTFGYKRAEILAAIFNSGLLLVIIVFLIKEAIHKFFYPEIIDTKLMFIVAIIGLIGNLISVLILNKDKHKTLNLRSAYLHLMADTLSSIVVILGAVLIYYYEFYWLDPALTILIAIYILKETWHVFVASFKILMEYVPENFDIEDIRKSILDIDEVKDVHDIHIWGLSEQDILFESHIIVDKELNVKTTDKIRIKIEEILNKKGINHITVQFETKCNKVQ